MKVARLYSGLCTRALAFGERAVWETYLGEARRFVRENVLAEPARGGQPLAEGDVSAGVAGGVESAQLLSNVTTRSFVRCAINFSKLHRELGWSSEHTDFAEGLAATIEWYLIIRALDDHPHQTCDHPISRK